MSNKLSKLIIIVLVTLNAVAMLCTFNAEAKSSTNIEYKHVVVYPGDTLWSIASEFTDDSQDIRYTIYQIEKASNLKSAMLYPGQELVVPVAR